MSDALLAYLNGKYLPRSEACLPIMDRGLLFGDSVYEVIPAYGGQPFRIAHHLDRLTRSLAALRMPPPLDYQAWHEVICRLTQQLPKQDQSVYLQVTRGAHPIRRLPIPKDCQPNVFAFTSLKPSHDDAELARGISAVTLQDLRWHQCNIKATTLLANVLARAQADEAGADEAIFIRDEEATEGTASNLFIVSGGLLITPPVSEELLPGVTRDVVLELAEKAGIPFAEARISRETLAQADEVWLTSSTREVGAVVRLDDQPVGNGKPGPHWHQMHGLFQDYTGQLREREECHDN